MALDIGRRRSAGRPQNRKDAFHGMEAWPARTPGYAGAMAEKRKPTVPRS
jgi:hypothetical protein